MDVKPDPFSREEQERRGHRIQWNDGWDYRRTWVLARDYPGGWPDRDTPPEGDGWERNTEVGDEGTPGFKVQDGASGTMWLSYWRRPRPR